jgi:KDO2-lipid IV(A) lauroyltransferase
MKHIVWILQAGGIVLFALPIVLMPYRIARAAGKGLGLVAHAVWSSRRKIAEDNVRIAREKGALDPLTDPQKVVRDFFQHMGLSIVELIKIYSGLGQHILDSVKLEGKEHFDEAKRRGKGIIFITGHCGNWEIMALVTGLRCEPVSVVARAQNNPYLNKMVAWIRAKYGNSIIYKQGALKAILSELRHNRGVGILMDQAVVANEGFIIDFLGRPAWTTKMPALIGRKTGAAMLSAFIHREPTGHVLRFSPVFYLDGHNGEGEEALAADTKQLSQHIEDYIRNYPSEWLWIHRRWKRAGEES